jgi:hypothetical protein
MVEMSEISASVAVGVLPENTAFLAVGGEFCRYV